MKTVERIKEEFGYDFVWNFNNGITAVRSGDKFFHIGLDGKPIYDGRYDGIGSFNNGIAAVRLNDKWFHIGLHGKPLYEERYDWVYNFIYGIAKVRLNNKYFHIDLNGKTLYEERYDDVYDFNNGIAMVELNGKEFHIDLNGKEIEPIEVIEEIGSRKDTLYIFKINDIIIFKTGCFSGNTDQFKESVKKTHKEDSKHYINYMEVINKYKLYKK